MTVTIPVNVTGTDKKNISAITGGGSVTLGSTTNVGETNIVSLFDNGNGNLILAQPITLTTAAAIKSLSFYVTTAGGQLRLGIYSKISNLPGVKLAETNAFTPIVGWNTQPTTSSPTLQPGSYFLVYFPQSNTLAFRKADTGGTSFLKSLPFGPMPAAFPATPSSTPSHWSFYGTFQEANVPVVWTNSSISTIPTDPWVNLDGRLNAQPGVIPVTNLLNTYHPGGTVDGRYFLGTGGGYQPPWRVSGVDYPIGVNRTTFPTNASLIDPSGMTNGQLQAAFGAGVTHGSGAQILVSSGAATFNGVNFATGVLLVTSATNVTVTNCAFGTGGGIQVQSGGTINNLTVRYCEFFRANDPMSGNGTVLFQADNGTCAMTVEYCWFDSAYSEHIQASNNLAATNIRYNYFRDSGTGTSLGAHGDWIQLFGSAVGPINISFNCFYQNGTTYAGTATQGVSMNAAAFTLSTSATVSNNVMISITNMNSLVILLRTYSPAWTVQNNYCDPTYFTPANGLTLGDCFEYNSSFTPVGPNPGTVITSSGNFNMLTGAQDIPQ